MKGYTTPARSQEGCWQRPCRRGALTLANTARMMLVRRQPPPGFRSLNARDRVAPALWCAFVAIGLFSGGSASETTSTTTVPTLASVSVSLAPSTIQVGQTATATAAGTDQNAKPRARSAVSRTSASPSIATVSHGGIVAVPVAAHRLTAEGQGYSKCLRSKTLNCPEVAEKRAARRCDFV